MDAIQQVTAKYAIDLLNFLCFSKDIAWEGNDQFNAFPVFQPTIVDEFLEFRGALLVNNSKSNALRLLVCADRATNVHKVCYRIVDIKNTVQIDNPAKLCYPMGNAKIDFSVSDLNLGSAEFASYSMADNTQRNKIPTQSKLFSLVCFILNASLVIKDDITLFEDLLLDIESQPPTASHDHYVPVFGSKHG